MHRNPNWACSPPVGSAVMDGLALPTTPPAIIAVADSPSRTRVVVENVCSWQRGCAVAMAEVRTYPAKSRLFNQQH